MLFSSSKRVTWLFLLIIFPICAHAKIDRFNKAEIPHREVQLGAGLIMSYSLYSEDLNPAFGPRASFLYKIPNTNKRTAHGLYIGAAYGTTFHEDDEDGQRIREAALLLGGRYVQGTFSFGVNSSYFGTYLEKSYIVASGARAFFPLSDKLGLSFHPECLWLHSSLYYRHAISFEYQLKFFKSGAKDELYQY